MAGIDKKLTDLTELSNPTDNAWIHVVEPTDISQNPAGSSYKTKKVNITPDATVVSKGKVKLAGDFDISSTADLPRIKDATTTVKGKIKLAGDFDPTSTADNPVITDASTTSRGVVTTGVQRFAGVKSFADAVLIGTNTNNGVDKLQVNGSASFVSDVKINGLTVGRGSGNDSTNAVLGTQALLNNATGTQTVAIGFSAFKNSTSPTLGVAIGSFSLNSNTSGPYNTAVGAGTLSFLISGGYHAVLGYNCLSGLTSGDEDVAIGYSAGRLIADGSTSLTVANRSVFLGANTKAFADNSTNEIVIGYNAIGNGSNSVTLGNSSITKTILRGNTLINTTTDNGVDKLQVNGSVIAAQYKVSALNTAPSSATDTGTTGEIRYVNGFIYVCVATNTWQRTALSTW